METPRPHRPIPKSGGRTPKLIGLTLMTEALLCNVSDYITERNLGLCLCTFVFLFSFLRIVRPTPGDSSTRSNIAYRFISAATG